MAKQTSDGGRVMADVTDSVVAAASRREPAALHEIYAALAPGVLGYLRSKGVADPEAVTNDVFVALLGQIERVSGGAAGLRTLTFSIAHARLVDDHRRRARTPETVSYEPDADERVSESAEESAHSELSAAAVRAVLAHLPEDQQEVLRLRVVADLSLEQTAEIMSRSVGAVKQLQRRGLVALRQALAERRVTL
jgi:RNA polymerase sigma-70 factor (ECF subfamily)